MARDAEAEVVRRLLGRDESALREVIETHGPLVYGIARRVVADPSLAEEVAQDTFLALWRRPGAFDPERGGLRSFLAGVARNKAVDLVRREQSARRARDSLMAEADTASTGGGGVERMEGIDEIQDLKAALGELSGVQRQAILLAYFGGMTYRQVADELGIPEGTAKTRLRDGLIRLRQMLASHKGSE